MNNSVNYILARLTCAIFIVCVFASAGYSQADSTPPSAELPSEHHDKPETLLKPFRFAQFFPEGESGRPFDYEFSKIQPVALEKAEGTEDSEASSVESEPEKSIPVKLGRSSGRWVIPDGSTEWGVEVGIAGDIATWMSGPKYYDIEDRGHVVAAIRWGKILGTRSFVTYSWAIEVLPINVALGNEVDNPRYVSGAVNEPRRNRENTWGVGINPASFRFIFFPQYRLRPQLGAGFGVVRHHKRVPTVEGTKMNFQVDFQVGGQYMLKENKALNFGYRYYHFSNLYLFNFNPGYNVNMWFVGYSIFK